MKSALRRPAGEDATMGEFRPKTNSTEVQVNLNPAVGRTRNSARPLLPTVRENGTSHPMGELRRSCKYLIGQDMGARKQGELPNVG
jgi:hypothetical protein